jgi:hypothetical protein
MRNYIIRQNSLKTDLRFAALKFKTKQNSLQFSSLILQGNDNQKELENCKTSYSISGEF